MNISGGTRSRDDRYWTPGVGVVQRYGTVLLERFGVNPDHRIGTVLSERFGGILDHARRTGEEVR